MNSPLDVSLTAVNDSVCGFEWLGGLSRIVKDLSLSALVNEDPPKLFPFEGTYSRATVCKSYVFAAKTRMWVNSSCFHACTVDLAYPS